MSVAIVSAVSLGGVSAASAATPVSHQAPASSSVSAASTLAAGSAALGSPASAGLTGGTLVPAPAAGGGQVAPQAIPASLRFAVRAGLAALKYANPGWYNAIRGQVNNGRAVFVQWWDYSVPSWVKNTVVAGVGGLGGATVYSILQWVLGLS